MAGVASLAGQTQWLRAGLLPAKEPKFAYVGTAGNADSVHVFEIAGERWRSQQVVPSRAPVSLALHPSGRTLFVLNEINEYQGLPSGSVEAYRVDDVTGQLELLGRQGLSLSATMPRQLAVAPDGKSLVVAVHGGGAYNLLPILTDRRLGRVGGILKETGSGPVRTHQDTAHPQSIVFDTTGKRVITADLGNDKVGIISVVDALEARARHAMPAGSGPRHLALHPNGHLLYVGHALDGSFSVFGYDAAAGKITEQRHQIRGESGTALVLHPTGDFLFTAGRDAIDIWQVDAKDGALTHLQSRVMERDTICGITPMPNGQEILALSDNGVLCMKFDELSGHLGGPALIASIKGARCVALL
jgi:6-phosphogluconolactonase